MSDEPKSLEDQLRVLADHLPFDVWVRDREDRCMYANPTALRHWPQLLGQRPADSGEAPDVVAIWEANNRRALGGEVVRGEVTYHHRNEEQIVHNLLAPLRLGGEIVGTVGANIDITAQRRAEDLLRTVFETSNALMGVRELKDGEIVHLADNPAMARFFGKRPEELLGLRESDLGVAHALQARTIESMRNARAEGKPKAFELVFGPEGERRTYAGTLTALQVEDRYFVLAEDVTAQRRMEEAAIRADRLATLGTLAASVAHEIKNPAAVTMINLEVLADSVREHLDKLPRAFAAELNESLAGARMGIAQIAHVVRDFGLLARPNEPALESVRVTDVVASVATLVRGACSAHAELRISEEDAPHARATAVRLAQVLINLVLNASGALARSGRKGTIEVRTGPGPLGVRIDVEDNGPGIPAGLRERLFDAFATSQEHGGSGLGLYLSRQMVQGFGGTLVALDRPGGGTLMRVELPAAP